MSRLIVPVAGAAVLIFASLTGAASAQGAAEEKLVKECNRVYAKLCKGVKGVTPGPEMLGSCFDKKPAIADKVPAKCVSDFQTNVENYHEAKQSEKAK